MLSKSCRKDKIINIGRTMSALSLGAPCDTATTSTSPKSHADAACTSGKKALRAKDTQHTNMHGKRSAHTTGHVDQGNKNNKQQTQHATALQVKWKQNRRILLFRSASRSIRNNDRKWVEKTVAHQGTTNMRTTSTVAKASTCKSHQSLSLAHRRARWKRLCKRQKQQLNFRKRITETKCIC